MFSKLCILGVGLIGGSLARAMRRSGECEIIVGSDRTEHISRIEELHIVDACYADPALAVVDADMIVIATPLTTMGEIMSRISVHLKTDAVVTDVGSTKVSVMAEARARFADRVPWFVPAHPIAGTEQSGADASFAELFDDRRVLLTPNTETRAEAISKVKQMWMAAGAASVETIAIEHHDQLLAASSHLPHMLAYALVDCLASRDGAEDVFRFAGGGFADFTRIAASNPQMWHDIAMANRINVIDLLRAFEAGVAEVRAALEGQDSEKLLAMFERAKRSRDDFGNTWPVQQRKTSPG